MGRWLDRSSDKGYNTIEVDEYEEAVRMDVMRDGGTMQRDEAAKKRQTDEDRTDVNNRKAELRKIETASSVVSWVLSLSSQARGRASYYYPRPRCAGLRVSSSDQAPGRGASKPILTSCVNVATYQRKITLHGAAEARFILFWSYNRWFTFMRPATEK